MTHIDAHPAKGKIHGVRLSIAGMRETFFFAVSRGEQERVNRYFRDLSTGVRVKDFIGFDTVDQTRVILVRGREVTRIEFTPLSKPAAGVESRLGNFRIFTRGNAKAFIGTVWDVSDAAWLMTGLDSEPGAFDGFWTYEDVFGEPVSIRVSDIVLAEIDSAVVEEGLCQITGYDEEDGEAGDIPF